MSFGGRSRGGTAIATPASSATAPAAAARGVDFATRGGRCDLKVGLSFGGCLRFWLFFRGLRLSSETAGASLGGALS